MKPLFGEIATGEHAQTRSRAIRRLGRQLQRRSWPRTQMSLLVLLTGGTGLLASYWLLVLGLESMALRYPLALGMAYPVFLCLLWLWVRTRPDQWADGPSPDMTWSSRPDSRTVTWRSGGGGDFAGAGASGSFDSTAAAHTLPPPTGHVLNKGSRWMGEADEWAVPLLMLVAALALVLSALYVVYSAPVFFAELLLDGALTASLYRRMRKLEQRHWLNTAVRRTVWPFLLTAVVLCAVGTGLQWYAPEAVSMGEALRHARTER